MHNKLKKVVSQTKFVETFQNVTANSDVKIHILGHNFHRLGENGTFGFKGDITLPNAHKISFEVQLEIKFYIGETIVRNARFICDPKNKIDEYQVTNLVKQLPDSSIEDMMGHGNDHPITMFPIWCQNPFRFEINLSGPKTTTEVINKLIAHAVQFDQLCDEVTHSLTITQSRSSAKEDRKEAKSRLRQIIVLDSSSYWRYHSR